MKHVLSLAVVLSFCLGSPALAHKTQYYNIVHSGYEARGCHTEPVLTLWDDYDRKGSYYKLENISVNKMDETRKYKEGGFMESDTRDSWRNEASSAEYVGRWEICRDEYHKNCLTFDSKTTAHVNFSDYKDFNDTASSARLVGCYDSGGGFIPAELPKEVELCLGTGGDGPGAQTIELRGTDGDGATLGQSCEVSIGANDAGRCCSTGYKGYKDFDRVYFTVKNATSNLKQLRVSWFRISLDASRYSLLGREYTKDIEEFSGLWLHDHTMCGLQWIGTCEAANAGLTDPKYDIFKDVSLGTDTACEEGRIYVNETCSLKGGRGARVICDKTNSCRNDTTK